jgi:hypothetical protein
MIVLNSAMFPSYRCSRRTHGGLGGLLGDAAGPRLGQRIAVKISTPPHENPPTA